jgi:hypothetical protein
MVSYCFEFMTAASPVFPLCKNNTESIVLQAQPNIFYHEFRNRCNGPAARLSHSTPECAIPGLVCDVISQSQGRLGIGIMPYNEFVWEIELHIAFPFRLQM